MKPELGATQNAGSKKKKALDKSESFGARDTERERRESGTSVDTAYLYTLWPFTTGALTL